MGLEKHTTPPPHPQNKIWLRQILITLMQMFLPILNGNLHISTTGVTAANAVADLYQTFKLHFKSLHCFDLRKNQRKTQHRFVTFEFLEV